MRHFTEHELIAFQLSESPEPQHIAEHLELCPECAGLAESIAETLRVFSAEPVPLANLDHAWQRLRGGLPVLAPRAQKRWWRNPLVWLAPVAALLLVVFAALHRSQPTRTSAPAYANGRPGPLTAEPAGSIAEHLDSAERLLTEVNHASGPLDGPARTQAHALLLSNAMYVQQARASGDLAQAELLDNLGRVLTTLDHQPPRQDHGWHVRLEMNTDGLLLDLRILQQNSSQKDEK